MDELASFICSKTWKLIMYLQQFLIIKLYCRVTKRKWESDMAYVVKLTETPM